MTVCNAACNVSMGESSASTVKCQVPIIPTTYSISNFRVQSFHYLKGSIFGSSWSNTLKVFDGHNPSGWSSTAKDCYFGVGFKEGYIGYVVEARFFMNRFSRNAFVNNFRLEGSNDNSTYTTIFTVGEEIFMIDVSCEEANLGPHFNEVLLGCSKVLSFCEMFEF